MEGLSKTQVAALLAEHGSNEIERRKTAPPLGLLLRQFANPMVWLLFGACVLSAFLGDIADVLAIGAIVILNAAVGFFQEYKAERALAALRELSAPRARVRREDRTFEIPAREVVPGDLLVLEAGDRVAADARLLEANVLQANEAPLTGESQPVEKRAGPGAPGTPLAERSGEIFLGTTLTSGTGLALVESTGMKTELGKIARMLGEIRNEPTPLQQRLAQTGRTLLWLCLAVVAAVAGLGILRGVPLLEVLLSATSLAVAAVPEGLPIIVTIALAVGVQRMAARNVLVRHLPAVETLGCVSVICADKTGTLTTGQMAVRDLWGPRTDKLLYAAAAGSNAELGEDGAGGTGDPTEIAILTAAAEEDILRPRIEKENQRVLENPFDSERKRMSVLRADGTLYVKGALESLVPLCPRGAPGAAEAAREMGRRGLRVLAVATGKGREEKELSFLGLIGMADPPRTDAAEAVARARRAGIQTVMITGDNAETARAIAIEMGLLRPGQDPSRIVHARVSPADKIGIVRDWKARGEITAMTGDGVNDAPALQEAHVGIAMGKSGTEVAREAADIILTDDNYASIVAGVAEGRAIFGNIQKTITYLLGGNLAEILLMLSAALLALPVPLLPLQILWVNLVTDGLPALALVTDPPGEDVLLRPPRRPSTPILGRAQWRDIALMGAIKMAVALWVFAWALPERGLPGARNLAFSTLVFGELFRAFGARSATRTFWQVGLFTNLRLFAIVLISAFFQIAIHHLPGIRQLFALEPISLADCLLTVALGLVPLAALEAAKLYRQRRARESA